MRGSSTVRIPKALQAQGWLNAAREVSNIKYEVNGTI
jgi:hypothetical protein